MDAEFWRINTSVEKIKNERHKIYYESVKVLVS